MENYREVTVLDNSSSRNSSAREKYRYLNSSHRNSRGAKTTYRTNERENYYSGYKNDSQSSSIDEEKINREFRRLMISTAIVGFAVFVKVFDFGFANALEDKFRSSLQTTSRIDNKISDSFVSFGQKVGINLDEISNNNDSINNIDNADNSNIVTDITTDSSIINDNTGTNPTGVIGEINTTDNNLDNTTDSTISNTSNVNIADEQISDFYIDDEILESVFEDGKK